MPAQSSRLPSLLPSMVCTIPQKHLVVRRHKGTSIAQHEHVHNLHLKTKHNTHIQLTQSLSLNKRVFLSLPNMTRWLCKLGARSWKESIHHNCEIKGKLIRGFDVKVGDFPLVVCPLRCWVSLFCNLCSINLTNYTLITLIITSFVHDCYFLMRALKQCLYSSGDQELFWPKQQVYAI